MENRLVIPRSLGKENWGVTAKRYKGFLGGGDKKGFWLRSSDGYKHPKNHSIVHFKEVHLGYVNYILIFFLKKETKVFESKVILKRKSMRTHINH